MPLVILRSIFILTVVLWYSSFVLRLINDYFRKEMQTHIEKDVGRMKKLINPVSTENKEKENEGNEENSAENDFIIRTFEPTVVMKTGIDTGIEIKHLVVKTQKKTQNFKDRLPINDEKLQNWLDKPIGDKSKSNYKHTDQTLNDNLEIDLNKKCIKNNINNVNDEKHKKVIDCNRNTDQKDDHTNTMKKYIM